MHPNPTIEDVGAAKQIKSNHQANVFKTQRHDGMHKTNTNRQYPENTTSSNPTIEDMGNTKKSSHQIILSNIEGKHARIHTTNRKT